MEPGIEQMSVTVKVWMKPGLSQLDKWFEDAELDAQLIVGRKVVLAFIYFLYGIAAFFITEVVYHLIFPMLTFLYQQDLNVVCS